MKTVIGTTLFALTCVLARAETWLPLEHYVKSCDLIILCKTEMVKGEPIFKVVEEWKGKYKPTAFNKYLQASIPKPGYLPKGLGLHSGRKSQKGQKVVFFFTPAKDKYSGSSTSFDVRNDKLVYAETGKRGVRKEYKLKDFKKAVVDLVETQRKGEQKPEPPAR